MPYFFFQMRGGEDVWVEGLSEHRAQILAERKPAFTTVLDAFSVPDAEWGRDDYAKMRYSGPCYFDFDAEDAADAIKNFQKFLTNLKDMGVNLHSLRLYATGGRGFHIEIPMPVFVPKIQKTGFTALPYIYKEMAFEMVVDTLDMRVNTGRKGRMWRTPGIERENGKFKVPISVADAFEMTPELYDQVCTTPIPEPLRDAPELNTTLAAMFMKSAQKVDDALKRRAKGGNKDEVLLARHKGQFPPTVERIMRGEGLAPGVGFHKLAMQLAITANALGKSADELVEASEGLCKTHESDSSRYSSPRKRKEELRRMWDYTHDNPCYGYSRGGIRSLCDVDSPTSDLDGVSENVGIGAVPDNDDEVDPENEKEADAGAASLYEGMFMTKSGIYRRTAEGSKSISNISFGKPLLICGLDDPGKVLGYEVDLRNDSVSIGRKGVAGKTFATRGTLSAYCQDYGGIFSGSDTQASVVGLMLSRSAKKEKRVVFALHKEGLDIVQNPLVKDKAERDVVWVHPDRVVTLNEDAGYKFQPAVSSAPVFYADVHNASPIKNTPDTVAWLTALMQVNSPTTTAQMLGWFVSSLHKQFYQAAHKQFPLLHPNGPAGSGKTLTALLMARMYHLTTPVVHQSCSTGTTAFALKAAFTGSASIPLVLDEYKPSEMGAVRTDLLLQAFRGAYNQGSGSSGGMSRGNAGASFRDITNYTYSTPICFLAEQQEMQTAIVQRTLPVSFNPEDAKAHTKSFTLAQAGADYMPNLGSALLRWSMQETVDTRRTALDKIIAELRGQFDPSVVDRQVFNLAVVMEGLNFLDKVLEAEFGSALRGPMETLKQSIWEHKAEINLSSMTEAAKMVNDMALISRTEEPESEFAIREAREYIVRDGYIEILLRESFVKYFAWCKRKGMTPLYSNAEAFASAMGKFPATVDKKCENSPLKTSGQSRVFRFSLEKLSAEGVEMFKTRSGS